MSSKKSFLLRKKIVKRYISTFKSFRENKQSLLNNWKDNLALIHSFSDATDTIDSETTFVDGYFSYHFHYIFFEIVSKSEWHPDYHMKARIIYHPKKEKYKSHKCACHRFIVFTRLNSITVEYLLSVLTFIEGWMDKHEKLIMDVENHCFFRLPFNSIVIADESKDIWINNVVSSPTPFTHTKNP